MTEREFQIAYLMGAYHEQQKAGNALTDVSFEHIEPTKLMRQQSKKQYSVYTKGITKYIHLLTK